MKTIPGISSVFSYMVYPTGEVLFRKFPCFCDDCSHMRFEDCPHKGISGSPVVVVKTGQNIKKNDIDSDQDYKVYVIYCGEI